MQLAAFDIAIISLIAGIATVSLLLLGIAKRPILKRVKIHHLAVYLAVVIQLLVAIFWMIPRSLWLISTGILSDPIGNWYVIVHDIAGLLALGIGLIISLIFLIKSGTPPSLVKRTRLWMKVVLSLWIIALLLGIINFYVGYLA